MLTNESVLLVGDNSGASKILVIRCLGGSNRKVSRIGDVVVATVKKVRKDIISKEIKKGQVVMALIVNTKKGIRRKDGSFIRFSNNYAIIVKKIAKGSEKYEPIASRISVPILSEFSFSHKKVFSLAKEIV